MSYLIHMINGYFAKGGPLMIFIFGVSVVASFIGLEKLLYLRRFIKARSHYIATLNASIKSCEVKPDISTGIKEFDDLLFHVQDYCIESTGKTSIYMVFREFLISAVPGIERGLSTMAAWISVAPLLGLLGTVGGMIETFRVITDYGLGNPNLTAEGISIALITTQAGLTVAFPMVLFHNYLSNMARSVRDTLFKDGEDLVNKFSYEKRNSNV